MIEKTEKMKRDGIGLGTLPPFTLFGRFFIPTLLGMLSISSVTALDGIFVGHGIGSDGIAAINICIPLLMLFTGVGLMTGAGTSVVASIHLSKGQEKAARIHVTQALLFATFVAFVPSVFMMIYPSATARWLGASEYLTPMVREYLLWFVPSLMFQMWCSVCLFVIRLDGRPKLAMIVQLIAAATSAALGYLFVFPLGWGLMGAALAATIGLFVGGLIGIVYLWRFADRLRLYPVERNAKYLRLTVRNIGRQCRIGFSALLAEGTLAMLMFVGNRIFMEYLGDDGVGAFGIACYYIPFVFMVGNAIAQSAQPIISYNFGLGLITAVFALLPRALVGLFIDSESAAARLAIAGFPYFSTAFVFFILNLCVIGYYQSVEQVRPAVFYALLRGFLFLVPCFILLPRAIGMKGIWLTLFVSEALTAAVSALVYAVGYARRRLCTEKTA